MDETDEERIKRRKSVFIREIRENPWLINSF